MRNLNAPALQIARAVIRRSHFLGVGQSGRTLIQQPLKRGGAGAYSFMHSTVVHLHQGEADAWAINLAGEIAETHRAQKGFGNSFRKVWSLEIQSDEKPDYNSVDWNAILERAIYAYDLNDPLLTEFQWPMKNAARK